MIYNVATLLVVARFRMVAVTPSFFSITLSVSFELPMPPVSMYNSLP
ncbi:MAG: hypothetical protein JWQ38_2065, partial [Flavipsychrobacter sp.]|nr:hypothetical protein [Flavipsychrobacter sp.]